MKGYELSRVWFSYTYEHPDKFTPLDTALYFWIIEVFNRAKWCEKVYLPSDYAMQHICCKSYKAYINSFNKLEAEGFIKVVQRSKNQYTANVIALVLNAKATTEASTKATTEASTEATTKASTVYKNIEHRTENIEQRNFDVPVYQRHWEIPVPQEYAETWHKYPILAEKWELFCKTRFDAHNARYANEIQEHTALKLFIKNCGNVKKVVEALDVCIAEGYKHPKVYDNKPKEKEVKLNHYGVDVSRFG